MKRISILLAAMAAFGLSVPAAAEGASHRIIIWYKAAPGHQLDLLKWLAEQDRLAEAAGTPRLQLYVHSSGSDWDYLVIQDETTREQEAALEATARRLSINRSPSVAIELRRHIISHEDMRAWGPMTPAEYLKRVSER
ncbi:MAG TPA: hypothetical protein VM346_05455 [Sphingomicrobium sp.]|nr:hypothetical protein [Sphingomicrobium sp.]